MRCPKCGFTSFDHLETCKKCRKYIGNTVAELNGTAHDAFPPMFLTVAAYKEEGVPVAAQMAGGQKESSSFGNETMFSLDEMEAVEQALEGEQEQPQGMGQSEIEFSGFGAGMEMEEAETALAPAKGEFVLEVDELAEKNQPALPAIDFGELDISDLAPPTTEPEPIRFDQPAALTDREPVAALSPTPPPKPSKPSKPPAADKRRTGLEDLNTGGLDLEAPSKLVTGSAAGKRFLPSVKTGTALDKFDVDLGDLFADNKK